MSEANLMQVAPAPLAGIFAEQRSCLGVSCGQGRGRHGLPNRVLEAFKYGETVQRFDEFGRLRGKGSDQGRLQMSIEPHGEQRRGRRIDSHLRIPLLEHGQSDPRPSGAAVLGRGQARDDLTGEQRAIVSL